MDTRLLPARVNDLINICRKTDVPKFIGFLKPEEAAIAVKQFKDFDKYALFGGYPQAERTVLAVLPDWCETPDYPVTPITFTYRKCDTLTHRDFLGSLTALGIARETVGDILIENGRAVAFVLSDIADFVLSQIEKVGKVGVALSVGYSEPLPALNRVETATVTVASARADCIVAALCGFSRSEACQKISDGLVTVNSVCCQKPTQNLQEGSTLTVRKKGRFEITSFDGYSKKGRIILKYNKFV